MDVPVSFVFDCGKRDAFPLFLHFVHSFEKRELFCGGPAYLLESFDVTFMKEPPFNQLAKLRSVLFFVVNLTQMFIDVDPVPREQRRMAKQG